MRPIYKLIYIFVIVLSVPAFAQKGTGFVGLSGCLSMPAGNWGQSNYIVSTQHYADDPAGYTGKGLTGGVEAAYFLSKYVGIGVLANYGTYKIKDLDKLSGGYQQSFDVDQVTTSATRYKMLNTLGGLYFNYPLSNKFSITARTLAGISHSSTPEITVDVEDGGVDDGTLAQEKASKTSFAVDAGAGIQYHLLKCFAIGLHGDFFYSKPDFSIANTQRNNSAGRYVSEYKQPLEAINISLGIAYCFGK